MTKLIAIENLSQQYKDADFWALKNLNLSLDQHKIIGLLGPNGAGKTTTISILYGLIKQTEGEVKILGHDNLKDALTIKKLVGVVPQQIALYPELTAKENLLYFGHLYKIDRSTLTNRINQYLSEFGLEEHANKRVKNFSGGMKRRTNIIAGLLHDPELIILDEPTAGVDIHSRQLILNFLINYNKQGKSIIYTSHLLEEADKICDEIVIINNGQLAIHDTTEKLKLAVPGAKNMEDVFMHYTAPKVAIQKKDM